MAVVSVQPPGHAVPFPTAALSPREATSQLQGGFGTVSSAPCLS